MKEQNLLEHIQSPQDVKALGERELQTLCGEIRETLIQTVSETGGHLASNLGVVELTVALHREMNCPDDSIVWDVGHQCYTHKLLTGRYGRFHTLVPESEGVRLRRLCGGAQQHGGVRGQRAGPRQYAAAQQALRCGGDRRRGHDGRAGVCGTQQRRAQR